MGLCLLFGVVLVANMRLLGWMRNAPLEGFHRLLPWGVWGFVANSVTGMMFFIGQAFQYIENPAFHLKMLCILLAGGDVLYLTWHDEIWEMDAGDTAPLTCESAGGVADRSVDRGDLLRPHAAVHRRRVLVGRAADWCCAELRQFLLDFLECLPLFLITDGGCRLDVAVEAEDVRAHCRGHGRSAGVN